MPTCTTRLCRRATSIIHRPSRTNSVSGFSTYTSLPAAQASIVIRACQWSGVETTTASTSLSSSSLRKSRVAAGTPPPISATRLVEPAAVDLGDGDEVDVGLVLEVEDVPLADQAEADEADADALVGADDAALAAVSSAAALPCTKERRVREREAGMVIAPTGAKILRLYRSRSGTASGRLTLTGTTPILRLSSPAADGAGPEVLGTLPGGFIRWADTCQTESHSPRSRSSS